MLPKSLTFDQLIGRPWGYTREQNLRFKTLTPDQLNPFEHPFGLPSMLEELKPQNLTSYQLRRGKGRHDDDEAEDEGVATSASSRPLPPPPSSAPSPHPPPPGLTLSLASPSALRLPTGHDPAEVVSPVNVYKVSICQNREHRLR
ncbi:hypothetical protein SK128_019439 [Halocaridina rubra]|uniref:Uncharacterized protein n=1 Tax=Halocaridina rubra TaxID=373956 RepID=A0AAN8X6U6_HALRR